MWFIPLNNEKSQKIGLRIYVENYNSACEEDCLYCSYLVLDNILGKNLIH